MDLREIENFKLQRRLARDLDNLDKILFSKKSNVLDYLMRTNKKETKKILNEFKIIENQFTLLQDFHEVKRDIFPENSLDDTYLSFLTLKFNKLQYRYDSQMSILEDLEGL